MADAKQLKKVADIVLSDPERRVVVVSAPGKRGDHDFKVTDLLINLANDIRDGKDYQSDLNKVISRYSSIANDLKLGPAITETIKNDLQSRIENRNTEFPKFLDCMKAAGEDNTAKLLAAYFKKLGKDAEYVNPKDAGLFLSEEYGNAQVIPRSYTLLKGLLDRKGVIVFPGFFGYSESGDIVTFSRGGSDVTGSIVAQGCRADIYEKYLKGEFDEYKKWMSSLYTPLSWNYKDDWYIWQYLNRGKLEGYTGGEIYIDMNVLNKEKELDDLIIE